jgi:hypothetical protein
LSKRLAQRCRATYRIAEVKSVAGMSGAGKIGRATDSIRQYYGLATGNRFIGNKTPSLSPIRWQDKYISGSIGRWHLRLIAEAEHMKGHTKAFRKSA